MQTRSFALRALWASVLLSSSARAYVDGRLSYVDVNPPRALETVLKYVPNVPSPSSVLQSIGLLELANAVPGLGAALGGGASPLNNLPFIKDLEALRATVLQVRDWTFIGAFVEIVDVARLRGCTTSIGCGAVHKVPYLRDYAHLDKDGYLYSREIAGNLKRRWQRYAESAYWHQMVSLNAGLDSLAYSVFSPYAFYGSSCLLSAVTDPLATSLGTLTGTAVSSVPDPELTLTVPQGYFAPGFSVPNKLRVSEAGGELDGGSLLGAFTPGVPSSDYCGGASLSPLDLFVVYVPSTEVCTVGLGCVQFGNFPYPQSYDAGAIVRRAQGACNRNALERYKDYLLDAYSISIKGMPLGVSWDGLFAWHGDHTGVLMAPVHGPETDKQDAEGKIGVPNKWERLAKLVDDPRSLTPFAVKNYFSGSPEQAGPEHFQSGFPGRFDFEELKRWVAPGPLSEQERKGYAPLFQNWAQWDTVLEARPSIYWASTLHFYVNPLTFPPTVTSALTPITLGPTTLAPDVVMTPLGCKVLPTWLGTLTHSVPRVHFTWSSVPEGYRIPRIEGSPMGFN